MPAPLNRRRIHLRKAYSGRPGARRAVGTLAAMTTVSLRTVKLRSGESFHDEPEVQLESLMLGGQRYLPVPGKVKADFTVTRASTGTVFELRFKTRLHGPCYRCMKDAVVEQSVAGREYQAASPGEADELRTPYVAHDVLDLSAWARDALVLALPDKILCQPDCAGLCPVCGVDLNEQPHEHAERDPDPRWAALAKLRDEL
jgi:uncharacterized protein